MVQRRVKTEAARSILSGGRDALHRGTSAGVLVGATSWRFIWTHLRRDIRAHLFDPSRREGCVDAGAEVSDVARCTHSGERMKTNLMDVIALLSCALCFALACAWVVT